MGTRRSTTEVRKQHEHGLPRPDSHHLKETVLIATVGAEGVVDTGASRTVVGSDRVKGILASLSTECRRNIRQVASKVTFRFGNSGTLDSKHALLIPTSGSAWIRVEVVQGATPLLISKRFLRELDAIIHVRRGLIEISGAYVQMRVDSKGLSVVDFAELMQHATATADTLLAESKTDTATPKQAASIRSNKEGTTDPSTISTLSAPPPSADQRPQSLCKVPVPELRSSQHAVGSRKEDPREGPRDRAANIISCPGPLNSDGPSAENGMSDNELRNQCLDLFYHWAALIIVDPTLRGNIRINRLKHIFPGAFLTRGFENRSWHGLFAIQPASFKHMTDSMFWIRALYPTAHTH